MKREKFSSRLGILLAMAGSAVGLGNMWRFPYMVGVNGGGAFILLYIIFVIVLCLPIFFSEFILGKRSQANAFGAFRKLAPGTAWPLVGILAIATPMIILSYYSVVGGWSLKFLANALSFSFTKEGADLGSMFGNFAGSTWGPCIAHTLFLATTAGIVLGGVQKGIERFSKVMMPLLFLLVIAMGIRTLTLPKAGEGLVWLFKPDFSKVGISVCAAALGQAFYSLSLGYGIMLTYSSYVDKKENIATSAVKITGMDLLFSLLASCAIMPAVFVFGLEPNAGAGLVFNTLPHIFATMPLGGLVAIIFFLALLVAALTSSVSLCEVGVAFLVEEKHLKRSTATIIVFAFCWIVGIFCALNGKVFDIFDYVSSNILMILGSLFMVIFVGWRMKRTDVFDEFTNGGTLAANKRIFGFVWFVIKWLAPIAVLFIFISNFIG